MLRNLVIAIVASTGGLLAIGTFLLGRDRARPDAEAVNMAGQPGSVRSSAGGVPLTPLGATTITSGQLDRGASAPGSPAPRAMPPGFGGMPPGYGGMPPAYGAMPPNAFGAQGPRPTGPVPLPTQMRGNTAPTPTPAPTPTAAPPPSHAPPQGAAPPIMGIAPMGTPPHLVGAPTLPTAPATEQQQQQQARPPAPAHEAGAGAFVTEPPPFNAGAPTPNADAGASPFVTDPSQAPH